MRQYLEQNLSIVLFPKHILFDSLGFEIFSLLEYLIMFFFSIFIEFNIGNGDKVTFTVIFHIAG